MGLIAPSDDSLHHTSAYALSHLCLSLHSVHLQGWDSPLCCALSAVFQKEQTRQQCTFSGQLPAALCFPTNTWTHDTTLSTRCTKLTIPHQLESHESAAISARSSDRVSKGSITQQIPSWLIRLCLHSSGIYQKQTANIARFMQTGNKSTTWLQLSSAPSNKWSSNSEGGMSVAPALLLRLNEIGSPAHHEKPDNSSARFLKAMTESKGYTLCRFSSVFPFELDSHFKV